MAALSRERVCEGVGVKGFFFFFTGFEDLEFGGRKREFWKVRRTEDAAYALGLKIIIKFWSILFIIISLNFKFKLLP